MKKDTIILACDHGGYELIQQIKKHLADKGINLVDMGAQSYDALDGFPLYIERCVHKMREVKDSIGIVACGTGIGTSIAANRFKGIRAALCHSTEYARLAREHNDANVLCLGGRDGGFASFSEVEKIIDTFLNTSFIGGKYKTRMDALEGFN